MPILPNEIDKDTALQQLDAVIKKIEADLLATTIDVVKKRQLREYLETISDVVGYLNEGDNFITSRDRGDLLNAAIDAAENIDDVSKRRAYETARSACPSSPSEWTTQRSRKAEILDQIAQAHKGVDLSIKNLANIPQTEELQAKYLRTRSHLHELSRKIEQNPHATPAELNQYVNEFNEKEKIGEINSLQNAGTTAFILGTELAVAGLVGGFPPLIALGVGLAIIGAVLSFIGDCVQAYEKYKDSKASAPSLSKMADTQKTADVEMTNLKTASTKPSSDSGPLNPDFSGSMPLTSNR